MGALRRDCERWCVELRCIERATGTPSTKLLVAKGLWQVQETLRCTSSLEVLGYIDEGEAEGSRTNGSTILRKETVGSRFTEGMPRAKVVSIPRLTLAFPVSTGCLVNVWDTMILYIRDHLV